MKIANSVSDLIGKTPLLELTNYEKKHGLNARLAAKLEYFNPRIFKTRFEDNSALYGSVCIVLDQLFTGKITV